MDKVIESILCNGCHACYSICPQRCISMIENEEGFLEPKIDKDKCLDCNLCVLNCPVNNNHTRNIEKELTSMVVINKNDEIREISSSGGVFAEIANYILEKNGSVYGAGFNQNFEVQHMRIIDKSKLYKLQGSKYVQSKMGNIFLEVKKDLKENRFVLFTGTPCQVEGLKSFLGKEYDKLYTQDIICHGVPSPKAWKKYIEEFKGNIKSISFRDKTLGWKRFSMKVETNNEKYINPLDKDIFLQSFLQNLNLRKSCYNCNCKKVNRQSDITLADFWGIDKIDKKYYDDRGTSLVILQSEKGKDLYEQIKSKFIFSEVDLEDAIKYNIAINNSVEMNKGRKRFFKNIDRYNYQKLFEISTKVTVIQRIINFMRKIKYKIGIKFKMV